MTDMRTRLKGLGVSEARLAAIGMGAPSTTAPTAAAEPPSAFRAAWDAHNAKVNAPKPVTLPSANVALDAAKVHQKYRDGNAIERAYLREHCGAAVELGRRIALVESPETPPEPPPKAA